MKQRRLHSLLRPKIRQSWNKYNLFNVHNVRLPVLSGKTFYQQKWAAKAMLRGYHGEHIKEAQWSRMFDRRLASVVDMDPRYLAQFDGSEQATGRGTGRQLKPASEGGRGPELRPWAGTNQKSNKATPYMQMLFAPMERRLDVAIFRSLFASSTRQARQFVVHGAVYVNGRKMVYPGYLLNPGDMFQVDVDRVLFATGAKKPTRRAEERKRIAAAAEEGAEEEQAEDAAEAEAGAERETVDKKALRELPYLAARAKHLLANATDDLNAKRKRALRLFVKDARKWIMKATAPAAKGPGADKMAPPPSAEIVDRLADLLADLPALSKGSEAEASALVEASAKEKEAAAAAEEAADTNVAVAEAAPAPTRKQPKKKLTVADLTPEERERFQQIIARDAENPVDPSKAYATPWRPRPFMSAFAFIPSYLEVNQNICAAVYLRHPVARPGHAEVPTPFPQDLSQLVYNWYLRRR